MTEGSPRAGARTRAAEVVTLVAGRLRDPDAVATVAGREGNVDIHVDGRSVRPWSRLSLVEGFPGVALLFAELGHHDEAYRPVTHAYLARACEQLVAGAEDGLYDGLAAVAFVARAARRAQGEYERLLAGLDEHVLASARALAAEERERAAGRRAGVEMVSYDVIRGLTGLGAYLLSAGHDDALADVLVSLVALTEPVTVDGLPTPGWWVPHAPTSGASGRTSNSHLNLGMAHGVAGPLALLALARNAGIRVPGQDPAMEHIATWLVARRQSDDAGPYWPSTLTLAEERADGRDATTPGRTAWCYGTPGVARALQLAGDALAMPSWVDTAVEALAARLQHDLAVAMAEGDERPWGTPIDEALCHGWSGVLHIAGRVRRDTGDDRLSEAVDRLADRVLCGFDPELPFGYRYVAGMPAAPDRAGFLEGAAGIALALHAYATDAHPTSRWDRALLLA